MPTGSPGGGSYATAYSDTASIFIAGNGGSVEGSTTQVLARGEDCSAVTATPTVGYHFVNWTGTGSFETTTANPLTVRNATADTSITANFAINTYTVTFDSQGGSPVTPVTGVTNNTSLGASMPVAPTKTGYAFTGWNTAAGGSGAVFTSTTLVTGAATVYAQWTSSASTVYFTATTGGSLEGSTTQVVESGADCTAVTANASSGYHFSNCLLYTSDAADE